MQLFLRNRFFRRGDASRHASALFNWAIATCLALISSSHEAMASGNYIGSSEIALTCDFPQPAGTFDVRIKITGQDYHGYNFGAATYNIAGFEAQGSATVFPRQILLLNDAHETVLRYNYVVGKAVLAPPGSPDEINGLCMVIE